MVQYSFTRLKDQLVNTDVMGSKTPPDQSQSQSEGATMNVDQRAFRDGYEPAIGDVFIAILGVTGAGKEGSLSLSFPILANCTSVHVHQQMLRETSGHRPQPASLHARSRRLSMPIQRLQYLPRRHARLRRHRSIRYRSAPRNRLMAHSIVFQFHQTPRHHLPPPYH